MMLRFRSQTISLGNLGIGLVLFGNKSFIDVIFVELELVVLQGLSSTQIVVVQFPFSQLELIFA